MATPDHSALPSRKEAFKFWLKLGFVSFGGPAGQISIMHNFVVEQKRWISESRFLHALNYCMLLPGPEAQQLAIYIGWLLHGVRGGLIAGILFVLPSMFILLGLSIAYVTFGHLPAVNALFAGLKPAVIAIIFHALFKIGKKSLHTPVHYLFSLAAFTSIFFLKIPFPIIIICAIVAGSLISFTGIFQVKSATLPTESGTDLESGYIINKYNAAKDVIKPYAIIRKLFTGILLWLMPVIIIVSVTADKEFWLNLVFFFTKAAMVTFGGAYAVLPYVAQVSVEKFEWLSQLQMIDGLALGETTPGPLIMILAFVGFMAGYNHFAGSILMGTAGLLATTWYTFLPCFLFIFIGAPFIERTHDIKKINMMLGFVTAAVVGVILNLAIYFTKAVVFPKNDFLSPDIFSLLWVVISFVALEKMKVGVITWIGISAIAGGLIKYLFEVL